MQQAQPNARAAARAKRMQVALAGVPAPTVAPRRAPSAKRTVANPYGKPTAMRPAGVRVPMYSTPWLVRTGVQGNSSAGATKLALGTYGKPQHNRTILSPRSGAPTQYTVTTEHVTHMP